MYNIIRYYNRNRKKIWVIILIIAFAVLVLRMMNNIAKLNNENNNNNISINNDIQDSANQGNYAVISNTNIQSNVAEENTNFIDEFILACNNQEIEKAYNMLSNECKEIKYPNIDSFKNNYYNNIFNGIKMCNKEAWMTLNNCYTYRVVIKDDALSTGKVSYKKSFEDFYTVVNDNGEKKLNISSYVCREYINSSGEKENIKINVDYKDVYMNYEIYTLNVQNNTDGVIKLDSKEKQNSTAIIGKNGTVYSSHVNEMEDYYIENNEIIEDEEEYEDESELNINEGTITEGITYEEELAINEEEDIINVEDISSTSKKNIVVMPNENKSIEIKFNKLYNPDREIIGMVFSDVVLNYIEYIKASSKTSYENRTIIEIYFKD